AAEEPAGLALQPLLLLRVRGFRRPGAVAAALPGGRLRSRRGGGRDAGGLLLGAGEPVPHLRRPVVGQVRRAGGALRHLRRLRPFWLSSPPTDSVLPGIEGRLAFSTSMGLVPFVVTVFVLGCFMSLGTAAVFRHIPVCYPDRVGAVGGVVGMVGGLGGFVLPI